MFKTIMRSLRSPCQGVRRGISAQCGGPLTVTDAFCPRSHLLAYFRSGVVEKGQARCLGLILFGIDIFPSYLLSPYHAPFRYHHYIGSRAIKFMGLPAGLEHRSCRALWWRRVGLLASLLWCCLDLALLLNELYLCLFAFVVGFLLTIYPFPRDQHRR